MSRVRSIIIAGGVFMAALGMMSLLPGGRGGLLDFLAGKRMDADGPEKFTPADAPPVSRGDVALSSAVSDEMANLVGRVMPSVVSIDTNKKTYVDRPILKPDGPEVETEVFREPGRGSGVIVSKEGHVLTNYHVIKDVDTKEIYVSLHGEPKARLATLIGSDPSMDIAVLKLESGGQKEFPALKFGDSDRVRVGHTVIALGNPFGLSETATTGIISNRDRRWDENSPAYFQIDAAINPGNSGGPLVNTLGEIIGINTAIFAGQREVRVWQGVGLAIPSNDAQDSFERIMSKGRPRVYTGLAVEQIVGFNGATGLAIAGVDEGSPAAAAQLKLGDLILTIDGKIPVTETDFWKLVRRKHPGDKVVLVVERDGVPNDPLELTLADNQTQTASTPAEAQDLMSLLGIKVVNMKRHDLARMRLRPDLTCIQIIEVAPDSPLAEQIDVGDLIFGLNGEGVASAMEFNAAINELPIGQRAVLRVLSLRGGGFINVSFTPTEK